MKEFKVILAGCFAIVLGSGCSTSLFIGGTPGSGVSATESRELDTFTEIEFLGSGKVNVVCGIPTRLTITADDNLLDLFETKVDGGTLIIRPTESISPSVTPTFEIATNSLNKIELSGSGDIVIEDIDSKLFEVFVTGSGSIDAHGTTEELVVGLTGSGSADLSDLAASDANAKLTGSGSAVVAATKNLNASVLGSGSLNYSGDPDIKKRITGSGNIRHIKTKSTSKAKAKANSNSNNDQDSESESSNHDDEEDDGESDA